jgi:hypothetical protein
MADIMDFTPAPVAERKFRIHDDEFFLVPDLPAGLLMEFAQEIDKFDAADTPITDKMSLLDRMFRMVMRKDSADLFIERLSSTEKPIGIEPATKVLQWAMEQYGLRPTEPSENSSDGAKADDGSNSTDSGPVEESTSEPSPSTGSST